MFGPNKWKLLTIVAGILLANAIDSPNRSAPRLKNQQNSATPAVAVSSKSSSFSSSSSNSGSSSSQLPAAAANAAAAAAAPTQLGLTIERLLPVWTNNVRVARNLLTPYKSFSNIDNVRYVARRRHTNIATDGVNWPTTTFGSFRYVSPPSNSLPLSHTRRRSDGGPSNGLASVGYEFHGNSSASDDNDGDDSENVITTMKPTTLQLVRRRKYSYIPLGTSDAPSSTTPSTTAHRYFDQTTLPSLEVHSRTDLNIFSSGDQPQALALQSPFDLLNKASMPVAEALTAATRAPPSQNVIDLQGRRSGMSFAPQPTKFGTSFQPQSYQEDDPSHPNFQLPYNEELSPAEPTEIRTARGATYESSYPIRSSFRFPEPSTNVMANSNNNKPFRDDVTKFGDVNGPVTAVQRQFSDYLDAQGIRTYENIYYSDDYRRPRQYYPSSSSPSSSSTGKTSFFSDFNDYASSQPLRSRLIVPYQSARSPRVIFPTNDNTFQGANEFNNNYNSNDNIVFR